MESAPEPAGDSHEAAASPYTAPEAAGSAHTAHEAPDAAMPAHAAPEEAVSAHVPPKAAVSAHTAHKAVVSAHVPAEAAVSAHTAPEAAVSAHTSPDAAVPAHTAPEAALLAHRAPGAAVSAHTAHEAAVSAHTAHEVAVSAHTAHEAVVSAHTAPKAAASAHTAPEAVVSTHTAHEAVVDDLDELTETVTSHISFCEDVFIPTRTHLTYNNDKPWYTAKLRQLCPAKENAYRKGGKVLYKQAKYPLEREIRVAKRNYSEKLRIQFSSIDSTSVWKGLKEITTTRHHPPALWRINNWQTIWMSSTAGLKKKHPTPALKTSPHNH